MQTRPSWKYLLEDAGVEKPETPRRRVSLGGVLVGTTALAAVGLLPFIAAFSTTHIVQKPVAVERDNQTILRADFDYGEKGTIYINDRAVPINRGEFSQWVDVSPFVRPGDNIIRIEGEVGKPLDGFNVAISHAATKGDYNRVAEFVAPTLPEPSYAYRFKVPDSVGQVALSAPGGHTSGGAR